MSGVLSDLAACIGFYTRLPVAALGAPAQDFARAQWAAPLAGALIGIAAGTVLLSGTWAELPPLVCALLAVAASVVLTGALHEDGLADTADGLGGGATRERKLEIMRDSRIGTYGVAALVFSILLRVAALAALAPGFAVAALIAAHMAGRAMIPHFLGSLPAARMDGLSANVGAVGERTAAIALAVAAVALLVLLGPMTTLVAATLLAAWFVTLKALAQRQLGGHTGDICGALEQGGEILVLLAAAAAFS